MLTFPPCSVAATSIAEPTTPTISTSGAISITTITGLPGATVCVRNPGAVTTTFAFAQGASGIMNVPSAAVTVCAATPTRVTRDTCAAAITAPDWSTTLPATCARTAVANVTNKKVQPISLLRIVRLLPREPQSSIGRSPDLRFNGPFGLPASFRKQWRFRSALGAYSSGAVLDLHQLPVHQRNFELQVYTNWRVCAHFGARRRGSYYRW